MKASSGNPGLFLYSSHKTMRTTTTLRWILGCLLHITWGSASDSCSKGDVLPINTSQINGLWNFRAFALPQGQIKNTNLDRFTYSYVKISLTEKEGTITEFFNPMKRIYGPVPFRRVDDEETLTYRLNDENAPGLFTFFQLHPDVLIVNRQSTDKIIKVSGLYVRSSSHPELKLEDFQEWSKCKELTLFRELNNTVDFAQTCYGLFEEKRLLHLKETEDIFTSWHLVAKSSTSMDQHYNVRILYTARIEISKEEQTLKEIITAPEDNVIHELKFVRPNEDGNLVETFKTEDGLLLLGVQSQTGRTFYLASRTPTVKRSVIEKFKAQALCFETKYNYFIPGSIREDDAGAEACAHNLEKWVPINFRESVGKWILTVSAYENTQMVLQEFLSPYGSTVITVVDDKVHLSHISIVEGRIITMEDIDVEESTGHIIYKGDNPVTRAAIYSVSPNCIVLSPEKQRLYLICRANHFPSLGDISQFVKYATCRNFNKILIRQPASFLCSEMPAEVHTLDVEKIAGTWKLTAVASNIPESAVSFPNEIQFTVSNGEVTITDGTWTSTAKKIGNNRLKYAKGDEHAMEMRFHEPLGDSLLTWVGNPTEQKVFLVLFSKSGHASPQEHVKFKHFAACLSIPVVFLKE